MSKRVVIPQLNLFYAEGDTWHVYVQLFEVTDGEGNVRTDIAFTAARDQTEAELRHQAQGRLIYTNTLTNLLERAKLFLKVDAEKGKS